MRSWPLDRVELVAAAEAEDEAHAREAVPLEQRFQAAARVIDLVIGGSEIARPRAAFAHIFVGTRRREIEHGAATHARGQRRYEAVLIGHVLDHLRAIDAVEHGAVERRLLD